MDAKPPVVEIDARYSDPDANPNAWDDARRVLQDAELYWITTVRPEGRPHVTPLIGVWHDEALWFCTGAEERKGRNLAANPQVVLTTGRNDWNAGLDVVVEGEAVNVRDETRLRAVAEAYEAKYGSDWHFEVEDGEFTSEGHGAPVFEVAPVTAFAFAKGGFAQTRYRFGGT
jgi:general stress protein 26